MCIQHATAPYWLHVVCHNYLTLLIAAMHYIITLNTSMTSCNIVKARSGDDTLNDAVSKARVSHDDINVTVSKRQSSPTALLS